MARHDDQRRDDRSRGSSTDARTGGNYVTGIGRPGFDPARDKPRQSDERHSGGEDRYGATAAKRFNEQGWYGGPERFAADAGNENSPKKGTKADSQASSRDRSDADSA